MTETRTQQLIRAVVAKRYRFKNLQQQEDVIQDMFRFADERNLDVGALVVQVAAYPGGEATTYEDAAVAITVVYMEDRTNKTLAQNHRDVTRALFDIPRNAKRVLGTFKKVPSKEHIRDYAEKHGMFQNLQEQEEYIQSCFAYATVRKLLAILLNRQFLAALEDADPEFARGLTHISNALKRDLDLYSEKAPFFYVDLNELVELVAGHIDDSGMTPDALLVAAQKILDDWEAK